MHLLYAMRIIWQHGGILGENYAN